MKESFSEIATKIEKTLDLIIVSATKSTVVDFYNKTPLGISLDKLGVSRKNIKIFAENTEGLPKLYNKFLTSEYKDKHVLFIHDDVMIKDLFFNEILIIAFEQYDIIGLAGSKTCDLAAPVQAWHMMTDRDNMVGEVAHGRGGKVWTSVFGPTNSRALVIDGLFIGVNVNKAIEKNLLFDETFDFHHYDISFSLRANKARISTGVSPLNVIHFGLGDSMNSPEWRESSEKFKKLYK